jgi:hypothetical protein
MSTRGHVAEAATDAPAARSQDVTAESQPGRLAATRPRLSPDNAASIQRAVGNAAMARLVAQAAEAGLRVRPTLVDALVELGPDVGTEASADGGPLPAPVDAAPATDGAEIAETADGQGKAGEGVFFGAGEGHTHGAGGAPTLEDGPKNEFGEMEGDLTSGVPACLFVNGGRVGEGIVHWAGGTGGLGQQGVGDIQLAAPAYEGAGPAPSGLAKAWITAGTGTATVTRSFRGVLLGANGTYYFTARARARADVHERLHVAASKAEHDSHIAPLEQRIAQHTGEPKARSAGATKDEAIAALKTFIDWNASVQRFRTGDTTQNTPLATVDTADLASADFIKDFGARRVGGVRYAHYMDQPPGPAAAPRRRGGAGGGAAVGGGAAGGGGRPGS